MTIQEFFDHVWEMLIGRTDGPLTIRLIFQPAVAAILAIRAGLKDARDGRTPVTAPLWISQSFFRHTLRRSGRFWPLLFLLL
jgi:hypothetical protein